MSVLELAPITVADAVKLLTIVPEEFTPLKDGKLIISMPRDWTHQQIVRSSVRDVT